MTKEEFLLEANALIYIINIKKLELKQLEKEFETLRDTYMQENNIPPIPLLHLMYKFEQQESENGSQ